MTADDETTQADLIHPIRQLLKAFRDRDKHLGVRFHALDPQRSTIERFAAQLDMTPYPVETGIRFRAIEGCTVDDTDDADDLDAVLAETIQTVFGRRPDAKPTPRARSLAIQIRALLADAGVSLTRKPQ